MKKLTILSFAIALMGIMAAMPVRAQQFRFCENEYTADATIPLGGGTATWNQAKTTLTLKNVKAENVSGYFIFLRRPRQPEDCARRQQQREVQ